MLAASQAEGSQAPWLQPEPGESVYDPSCGSGWMLVSAINQLRESGKDHRTLRVYGQEINLTAA